MLRSPLGSRTQVHSPRFSLAKPARLCDITAYKLYWSMCRLTATRVVAWCAACAAYERLTALFGVCGCVRRVLSCLYIDKPVGIAAHSKQLPPPYTLYIIPRLSDSSCSLWREWVFSLVGAKGEEQLLDRFPKLCYGNMCVIPVDHGKTHGRCSMILV